MGKRIDEIPELYEKKDLSIFDNQDVTHLISGGQIVSSWTGALIGGFKTNRKGEVIDVSAKIMRSFF